jgi:Mor family transcriptional regulator
VVNADLLDSPDMVDMIVTYIVAECPELAGRDTMLRDAIRREFSGIEIYIPRRSVQQRQLLVEEVLRRFNGRNATEVARVLNIGRATVYRIIKQSGRSGKV